MLKYENYTTQYLVQSTARILDLANLIQKKPREQQELEIWRKLSSEEGSIEIKELLSKAKEISNPMINLSHVKSTLRILKMKPYDSYGEVTGEPASDEESYFDTEPGSEALKRLKLYKNTVIAYHAIEIYGYEKIKEDVNKLVPNTDLSIMLVDKKNVIKTRLTTVPYRTDWVYQPILPLVVLRKVDQD